MHTLVCQSTMHLCKYTGRQRLQRVINKLLFFLKKKSIYLFHLLGYMWNLSGSFLKDFFFSFMVLVNTVLTVFMFYLTFLHNKNHMLVFKVGILLFLFWSGEARARLQNNQSDLQTKLRNSNSFHCCLYDIRCVLVSTFRGNVRLK